MSVFAAVVLGLPLLRHLALVPMMAPVQVSRPLALVPVTMRLPVQRLALAVMLGSPVLNRRLFYG